MAAPISAPLAFEPTSRTLAAAIEELERLGENGGGAVDADVRLQALREYARFGRERKPSPNWRYDYAALSYEDIRWSTGRVQSSLTPERTHIRSRMRGATASATLPRGGDAVSDAPSLALDNAGGLAHAGSIFLEAPQGPDERPFTLTSLADAKRRRPERVAAVHQRIVVPNIDRFAALATAFQNCGAFVDIPGDVRVAAPLQLLWTARPGAPSAVFPHSVIRLGPRARATVVERHIGWSESFVAGIVEIELAADARLDYVVVQQTGEGTRLLFRRHARCAAGARIGWHLAEHGGGLVRSVVRTALREERARADVNALFFASGFEHVDLDIRVEHLGAATHSRAVVRGGAFDRAQGRYRAALRATRKAPGSHATWTFDALRLSPRTFVTAASPIAIGAEGVAVSNTAKVGSLGTEELFYVQSRGIARRDAEHMMALAFFEPAIRGFPSEALRDEMRAALDVRLDEIPETFAP